MARGSARAPSQHAYRGSIGRTQTATVHVTGPGGELVAAQVFTTIDSVSDPELVERLHSDDPDRTLNMIRLEGAPAIHIAVPVLYHDPAAELMVLVLGESHRHREIEERIRLFEKLRTDDAAVPAYVKEFAVVFGSVGLRAYLERRAEQALGVQAEKKAEKVAERANEKKRAELATREAELEQRGRELERHTVELEIARAEVAKQLAGLEAARGELDLARGELRARVLTPLPLPAVTAEQVEAAREISRDDISTKPIPKSNGVWKTPKVARPEVTEVAKAPVTEVPKEQMWADETNAGAPAFAPEVTAAGPAPLPPEVRPEVRTESSVAHVIAPMPRDVTPPPRKHDDFEGLTTAVVDVEAALADGAQAPQDVHIEFDEETTGASIVPQGSDPLTTETAEQALGAGDPWLDDAAVRLHSSFEVTDAGVRLVLIADETVARGLGGTLDIRILLHRTAFYPVVTLVIGPPAALRVASLGQLATIVLDIGRDTDRAVLTALAKHFELTVEIVARGRRIRRVQLTAPLGDNAAYVLRAADDHLRSVATEGGEVSFDRGRDLVSAPTYDLLGAEHVEAGEFRDDKLAQLESAQQLRRAIAMARRFAKPSREDYLVCTRGFPLTRWRELRRHVLESAVMWGLWMGPELAQVAVSEGLARSRRDLVVRLDNGFEVLRRHPTAFDVDTDAAEDNLKALAEEARALGVELKKSITSAPSFGGAARSSKPEVKNGAIVSDEMSVVSGSIEGTPQRVAKQRPVEELIALLDDRQQRVAAALELCERGDGRAAVPVIATVKKLSRAEAVRVLGMSVKLGEAAKAPLLEGLGSSKAFLRHGCALALAMLRTEDGTQAVIELLLDEPTEIWREVARAIGQIGPTGLMPLASNFGRLGDRATPAAAERVAWAMAHVGVRGGKTAIETMAGGSSVVAPVAKRALELLSSAAEDQVRVHPNGGPARDVTVNRAFSRRFFEALEHGIPAAGQAGLGDLDASQPMEQLDEADLIEDEEAELDESDLIQT